MNENNDRYISKKLAAEELFNAYIYTRWIAIGIMPLVFILLLAAIFSIFAASVIGIIVSIVVGIAIKFINQKMVYLNDTYKLNKIKTMQSMNKETVKKERPPNVM